MENDQAWEGEALETTPFAPKGEQVSEESTFSRIWNRFFGLFVSTVIGVYAGLISRTMQEAWIYAALYCGEALVCACVAGIIKSYSFKKTVTNFALYFVISAVATPISCWLGIHFA